MKSVSLLLTLSLAQAHNIKTSSALGLKYEKLLSQTESRNKAMDEMEIFRTTKLIGGNGGNPKEYNPPKQAESFLSDLKLCTYKSWVATGT